MEVNPNSFLNQEDDSDFYSFFQEPFDPTDSDDSLNKRSKLDELYQQPTSKSEIPNSDFQHRASEMADWDHDRVRKSRIPSPAGSYGGTTAADGGGGGGRQRRVWVKERPKGWWEYYDREECPDNEFRKAFRMTKATFNMICDELDMLVTKKDTMLRMAIPVRQRVAVCVYRLATGDPLRKVSAQFGLGISTCHKLVLEVCAAIHTVLMPKFLRWPDEPRLKQIETVFRSVSGIPNVHGSIYTTHVSIIAPKINPEASKS